MDNLTYNKKILNDILNFDYLPEKINTILRSGKLIYYYVFSRTVNTIPKTELCILDTSGFKKIYTIGDCGNAIQIKEISVNAFQTKAERNSEIYHLYHKEGLSQLFLAKLFNISQPTISLIVNNKSSKNND